MPTEEKTKQGAMDTSSALFGVAAIQALIGFMGWLGMDWKKFSWMQWTLMLSAFIFAGLGILAKKFPLLAIGLGGGLFLAYLLSQAAVSFALLTSLLVYKLPVCGLLMIGLVHALKNRRK